MHAPHSMKCSLTTTTGIIRLSLRNHEVFLNHNDRNCSVVVKELKCSLTTTTGIIRLSLRNNATQTGVVLNIIYFYINLDTCILPQIMALTFNFIRKLKKGNEYMHGGLPHRIDL